VARTQHPRHLCSPANKPHRRRRLRHRSGRSQAKFGRVRTFHRSQLDCGAPPRSVCHPAAAAPRPEPTLPRRSKHELLRSVPRARAALVRTDHPRRRGDPDDAARRASFAGPGSGIWRRFWKRTGIAGSACALWRAGRHWGARIASASSGLWHGLWWEGLAWPEGSVCRWEDVARSAGSVRKCIRSAVAAGYCVSCTGLASLLPTTL
jgi:hypothetical protein